ncbi:MAG: hypothetical protein P8I94_07470 [Emcibacteraceae bacterium]|nr:hypothetical protein [Emcibacteraceae bacterium]
MTSENHKINRRDMFKIGGAVVGSITAAGMVSSADARMRRPLSFIIQNATVLTMDEKQGAGGDNHFGQIDNCDVYVLDGKIEEVGKNLAVLSTVEVIDGTDQIVLPGFVDGHRHLWQTAMRNRQEIFGFGNYGPQGINKYSPSYSAHDMEVSAYMGGLEALNAGVTSAVDFCHNS